MVVQMKYRYNRVDVNTIGYEYFIVQLVNQKHQQKVLI